MRERTPEERDLRKIRHSLLERKAAEGVVVEVPCSHDSERLLALAEEKGITVDKVFEAFGRYEGKIKLVAKEFGVTREDLMGWMAIDEGVLELLEDELEQAYGIMATVADKYGMKRRDLSALVKTSQRLQLAIVDGKERMLDRLEQRLMELIEAPGAQAITPLIFTLKTRGQQRGYIERAVTFDIKQLTTEQLQRIKDGEDPLAVLNEAETALRMRLK